MEKKSNRGSGHPLKCPYARLSKTLFDPSKSNSTHKLMKSQLKAKLEVSKSGEKKSQGETEQTAEIVILSETSASSSSSSVISLPVSPNSRVPSKSSTETIESVSKSKKPNDLIFTYSTFNRLVEDNFITISLQDELLALNADLRQFEENKYSELKQFIEAADGLTVTEIEIDGRDCVKRFIEKVQNSTEKWINSLKKISSFKNVGVDDQILCLRTHFVDLIIIRSISNINPKVDGQSSPKGKCPLLNHPVFNQILSSMNTVLRLDPMINLLVVLIYLFDVDVPNLQSPFSVRKEYIVTIHLLQKYLELSGLTMDQANSEIKKFITDLSNFLAIFNGRDKVLTTSKTTIRSSSQLLTEILGI